MKKYFFFTIIVVFYCFLFSFFVYRFFVEKTPRDPVIFTGFFLVFLILTKTFKYVLKLTLQIYFFIKKVDPEKKSKFATWGKAKIERIDFWYQKEFTENFLYNWQAYSYFSLFLFKIYDSQKHSFTKIHVVLIILPWVLLNLIYFFEIFNGSLYLFFYILPMVFFLRKLEEVLLKFSTFESERLLNFEFEKNFPNFYYSKENALKDFFLVNRLMKCHFLFHVSQFQTKNHILFFWISFNKLIYYNLRYRSLVDFSKPTYRGLKELLYRINCITFSSSFILLLLPNFGSFFFSFFLDRNLLDFFTIFLIFFSVFLIFLCGLKFLADFSNFEKNTQYTLFFESLKNLQEFYQQQLFHIKEELLETYEFLNFEDLMDFSDTKLSVSQMHIRRKTKSDIFMTLEEIDFFFTEQKKLVSWFTRENVANRINMETFEHEPMSK